MKQKIIKLLLLCILFSGVAISQDRPHKQKPDKERPSTEEMVKREMKMLKQELDLTETQVTFIQKILNDSYKKMEDNFKSENKDRDEMEKIMQEKDDNIKQVLTEEQLTKYKDMKDKRKDKFNQDDKPSSPPPDRN